MSRRFRLAAVATHPIQYQGPLFRLYAQHPRLDFKAYFGCDHGQQESLDPEFGTSFAWNQPLTAGYAHEHLQSLHPKPGPSSFWGCTNPQLWERMSTAHHDAVLVPGWNSASYLLAMRAAQAHGVRVLVRGDSHHGSYEPRSRSKRIARNLLLETLFTQIDGFLSVGRRNTDFYRSLGVPESRIFPGPHAVDNAFFEAQRERLSPERAVLRQRLGVDDERSVLLVCGKLIPRKAPLDVVEAFAQLRTRHAAHLVFAGDGPLRAQIEARAAELGVARDMTITGFKQPDELCEAYVAADVFVFPTRFETWGLVLNEAMVFGLPAVCTRQAGAADDLVQHGVTGLVYDSGDTEALRAHLEALVADAALRGRMGAAGRARIDHWTFAEVVQGTLTALDQLVQR